METLIKNAGPEILECNATDAVAKAAIDNRVSEANLNLSLIQVEIDEFHSAISASVDTKIRNIKDATTFPVNDILQMIIDHPGCTYVRVYNGFNSNGKFVAYLVPLDANLKKFKNCKTSRGCCHCSPCKILND